jgi:DNA segregation ATPase FtsK/SpoIIIE, S-DNA-T family
MMSVELVWAISVVLCLVLLTERWWAPHVEWALRRRDVRRPWVWYLAGYPLTLLRMRWTWRRLCQNTNLSVVKRPRYTRISRDAYLVGQAFRPDPPWLGLARVTRDGLTVRVRMHPGQTPGQFVKAAAAMAHAWRMHAVRVSSPRRGEVLLRAVRRDPLASGAGALPSGPRRILAALVGKLESGEPWVIDFRKVPHWLVVGATQSGKSTLVHALVSKLAPQPVALVGIDLKGGLELTPVQARLSALASNRAEAVTLLEALVGEARWRMTVCRSAGVRSVWELSQDERPVPVVVLVDELAELYLPDGSPESRKEVAACSAAIVRLAQLGAALAVHLVVAGQRVGSELGPGVTALRAQLGGRVCHRVHDEQTAEMTLGDVHPDAVQEAQTITEDEAGVSVTTVGGSWTRARSTLVTPDEARHASVRYAHRAPALAGLQSGHGKGAERDG